MDLTLEKLDNVIISMSNFLNTFLKIDLTKVDNISLSMDMYHILYEYFIQQLNMKHKKYGKLFSKLFSTKRYAYKHINKNNLNQIISAYLNNNYDYITSFILESLDVTDILHYSKLLIGICTILADVDVKYKCISQSSIIFDLLNVMITLDVSLILKQWIYTSINK
ncbi:hypothetical protein EPTV-WA-151 [Eptesipox virus]|uniref:Uncharacterized protein n=1 Tax=Eptesipox virus TaxID=1329402 RepID=A0A220T6M5_9POXV|nr:hypothetical protein CG743_gp151 [Eptesipox virus]ASK51352.1 hypothetical protein EPTV-WA-151 [Eptesipox virus]WAH71110.1 hypothetical protein CG743_gp151 [Eptesipox virus]